MGNLIHRGKGSFTHVENTIFFERGLSAKAKGVNCQIRSLESNPEWVFTIAGFASLFKDDIDSIKSSLKELERFGFLIRARKSGAHGRIMSSEESLWITLDHPSMYSEELDELASQGFSIASERDESKAVKPEIEQNEGEAHQVKTTYRLSTCGEPVCGQPTYGQTTCGKSATINLLGDSQVSGSVKTFPYPLPRNLCHRRPWRQSMYRASLTTLSNSAPCPSVDCGHRVQARPLRGMEAPHRRGLHSWANHRGLYVVRPKLRVTERQRQQQGEEPRQLADARRWPGRHRR